MKHIINTFAILIIISCKAQTPIFSLSDLDLDYAAVEGAYYKDVDNFFNNFEGTWIWQDGNNSLTIVLQKVEEYPKSTLNNPNWFTDLLFGEFKYVENGVVIADYLNAMTTLNYDRSIVGNSIIYRGWFPMCNECPNEELRVILGFKDPERPFYGRIVLRHGIQWWNQQEYIIAKLFVKGSYVVPDGTPLEFRVPDGEYLLLKQ
tara:strand:- start:1613 stop:2224 length:612 start_codon:yes stop_codon:yes gene_type:complete